MSDDKMVVGHATSRPLTAGESEALQHAALASLKNVRRVSVADRLHDEHIRSLSRARDDALNLANHRGGELIKAEQTIARNTEAHSVVVVALQKSLTEACDALRKIKDECQRMRKGTDDWFDLVEIEAICVDVLSKKG